MWKSYLGKGVFVEDANYDIPSNWDAYDLFSLMNKGDHRLAEFSTKTLQKISEENKKASAPRAPRSGKRKKKGEASASYTDMEGQSSSAWDLKKQGESSASPSDAENHTEALGSTRRQKKAADKARRAFCPVFYDTSRRHFERGQATLVTEPEDMRSKFKRSSGFAATVN